MMGERQVRKRAVLITQELVTVRKNVLGQASGSIASERNAIVAALDLLFTGF